MIPKSQRTADPLNEFDHQVGAILSSRRGAANALAIREIISRLYPEEWITMGGSARWLKKHERHIKQAVHNLRRAGRQVGSTRGGLVKKSGPDGQVKREPVPVGYFMVATAAELEETISTLRRQAIDMFLTAGRMAGRDDSRLRDFAGQMRLELEPKQEPEARSQESA